MGELVFGVGDTLGAFVDTATRSFLDAKSMSYHHPGMSFSTPPAQSMPLPPQGAQADPSSDAYSPIAHGVHVIAAASRIVPPRQGTHADALVTTPVTALARHGVHCVAFFEEEYIPNPQSVQTVLLPLCN